MFLAIDSDLDMSKQDAMAVVVCEDFLDRLQKTRSSKPMMGTLAGINSSDSRGLGESEKRAVIV